MSKETRRSHDPAFKKRVVARLLAEKLTVGEAADHYEVSQSLLRRWSRDPRYGGRKSAFRRSGRPAQTPDQPTLDAAKRALRGETIIDAALEIVTEVVRLCPHCRGRVELPE